MRFHPRSMFYLVVVSYFILLFLLYFNKEMAFWYHELDSDIIALSNKNNQELDYIEFMAVKKAKEVTYGTEVFILRLALFGMLACFLMTVFLRIKFKLRVYFYVELVFFFSMVGGSARIADSLLSFFYIDFWLNYFLSSMKFDSKLREGIQIRNYGDSLPFILIFAGRTNPSVAGALQIRVDEQAASAGKRS